MTERRPSEAATRSADPVDIDRELSGMARALERRFDPGPTALVVAVAVLVVLVSLVVPWTGTVAGWQVLAGDAAVGPLPRLFSWTAAAFGLAVPAFALATRWWALAWLSAVGGGIAVVTGVWAFWSRQTPTDGGAGPGVGIVLAVLAMVVLAVSWTRIALRR